MRAGGERRRDESDDSDPPASRRGSRRPVWRLFPLPTAPSPRAASVSGGRGGADRAGAGARVRLVAHPRDHEAVHRDEHVPRLDLPEGRGARAGGGRRSTLRSGPRGRASYGPPRAGGVPRAARCAVGERGEAALQAGWTAEAGRPRPCGKGTASLGAHDAGRSAGWLRTFPLVAAGPPGAREVTMRPVDALPWQDPTVSFVWHVLAVSKARQSIF